MCRFGRSRDAGEHPMGQLKQGNVWRLGCKEGS